MIEGNFKDASLPGLLQFLATESNKLYRVKLSAMGNTGEVYVDHGHVIAAKYNLLDGEDAMCEFLSWRDGAFSVERLPSEFESTVNKNLHLRLQGPTTFVSQSAFLVESSVGLNTIVVPSRKFGGLEWQDALRTQPLEREDFLVMAWIKEGRSMREACREFGFDIVKATGILYRLLLTHSVEPQRAFSEAETELADEETYQIKLSPGNASQEMAMLAAANPSGEQKRQRVMPIDLASLRASMEARLRSKELEEAARVTKPQPAPTPVSSQAAQSSGGAHVTGMVTSTGQFEAVAVSTTLSALGAAIESKPYQGDRDAEKNISKVSEVVSSALALDDQSGLIDCAPDPVARPESSVEEEWTFTAKRTDALPLVTIDIERLLQATFTATQFGKLALTNQALDPHLRQTLLDVESGKTLTRVINEAVRGPASILSTYRFCLARGYVISADPVIPLTADMLLGRMALDQYLLQRRRINGDELRDLIELEREKGIKLSDLLVRHGYLTPGDLERLLTEQKRFALK
jgi:hypothetical protein